MKQLTTLILSLFCSSVLIGQIQKVVLVEEGTGTWCQWCPRGDVYGQLIAENYPDNAIFLAVHSGDAMENEIHAESLAFTGLPNGAFDRVSMSQLLLAGMASDMAPRLASMPPAGIAVSTDFNIDTRVLNMTVSADFANAVSGDYRLAAIVAEDGVTGPSPTYDQSNSYSGGDEGPMGGYENLPQSVPASIMVYNHVSRHLAGGFNGEANSLPTSINAGENHEYTYTYTLPEEYNADYVYVVGILVNATTGEVLNAGKSAYLPGYFNGKPFFHSQPQEQAFIGINYNYEILTHDPEHDDLSISSISNLPDGLSLVDLGDGKATLSGSPSTAGSYEITLNVSDGEWDIEQSFTLNISVAQQDWVQLGNSGFSNQSADNLDIKISDAGDIYTMLTSNDLVYIYKYEDESWTLAGPSLNGNSYQTSMALGANGVPYVFTNGIVSKLEGGQWTQVGSNLPGSTHLFGDIIVKADGTPIVVYFNPPSTTSAYSFDGNNWMELSGFSDNAAVWNRLKFDQNENPIAIYGTDGSSIAYSEVAQYDGSNWNVLGNGYVEPSNQTYFDHDLVVTANGDIYAALTIDVGAQQLNVYKLENGSWTLIGENISGGATESCQLASTQDGELIVAFNDLSHAGRVSAMSYNGSEWTYVGLAGFTNIASDVALAIDAADVPYVVYKDESESGKLSVKKYEDINTNTSNISLANFFVQAYPNPNNGSFTLNYEQGTNYTITDLNGKLIGKGVLHQQALLNNTYMQNIDFSYAPKGLYLLSVFDQQSVRSIKIIKQ